MLRDVLVQTLLDVYVHTLPDVLVQTLLDDDVLGGTAVLAAWVETPVERVAPRLPVRQAKAHDQQEDNQRVHQHPDAVVRPPHRSHEEHGKARLPAAVVVVVVVVVVAKHQLWRQLVDEERCGTQGDGEHPGLQQQVHETRSIFCAERCEQPVVQAGADELLVPARPGVVAVAQQAVRGYDVQQCAHLVDDVLELRVVRVETLLVVGVRLQAHLVDDVQELRVVRDETLLVDEVPTIRVVDVRLQAHLVDDVLELREVRVQKRREDEEVHHVGNLEIQLEVLVQGLLVVRVEGLLGKDVLALHVDDVQELPVVRVQEGEVHHVVGAGIQRDVLVQTLLVELVQRLLEVHVGELRELEVLALLEVHCETLLDDDRQDAWVGRAQTCHGGSTTGCHEHGQNAAVVIDTNKYMHEPSLITKKCHPMRKAYMIDDLSDATP
eukprot:6491726-Amphidinium_carterae.1